MTSSLLQSVPVNPLYWNLHHFASNFFTRVMLRRTPIPQWSKATDERQIVV